MNFLNNRRGKTLLKTVLSMIINCIVVGNNTTYMPRHFLERTSKELQILQPIFLTINGRPEEIIVSNLISRSMYPGLDNTYIELDINPNNNIIKVGDYLNTREHHVQLKICQIIKT
jgi:hypothetical protein